MTFDAFTDLHFYFRGKTSRSPQLTPIWESSMGGLVSVRIRPYNDGLHLFGGLVWGASFQHALGPVAPTQQGIRLPCPPRATMFPEPIPGQFVQAVSPAYDHQNHCPLLLRDLGTKSVAGRLSQDRERPFGAGCIRATCTLGID